MKTVGIGCFWFAASGTLNNMSDFKSDVSDRVSAANPAVEEKAEAKAAVSAEPPGIPHKADDAQRKPLAQDLL